MIKKIKLRNIQSHQSTDIELCGGINVLVGSSNNGKSAILRGLYWVRNNRPLGIDTLASHWALDKKGNLSKEMSVEVENENGTVIRRRTADENQYIVNGNVQNVVKTDVPADVSDILRLSDTNIQRQLDEPFLLSQTTGEVAKYFNHIARLDVIDTALTNAESMRRQCRKYGEATEVICKDLERKLDALSWLGEAEALIAEYDKVKADLNAVEGDLDAIQGDLNAIEGKFAVVSKYKPAIECAGLVGDASALLQSVRDAGNDADALLGEAGEVADSAEFVARCESAVAVRKSLSKLSAIQKMIDDDLAEVSGMKIDVVEGKTARVAEIGLQIKDWCESLPTVCPLCGQPMDFAHNHRS